MAQKSNFLCIFTLVVDLSGNQAVYGLFSVAHSDTEIRTDSQRLQGTKWKCSQSQMSALTIQMQGCRNRSRYRSVSVWMNLHMVSSLQPSILVYCAWRSIDWVSVILCTILVGFLPGVCSVRTSRRWLLLSAASLPHCPVLGLTSHPQSAIC